MAKAPFPNARPGMRVTDAGGPGALTWAWGAFLLIVIALVAAIQFIDWPGAEDGSVTLALDGEPERFARPDGTIRTVPDGEDAPALAVLDEPASDNQSETTDSADGADTTLPSVRAARPGEFEGASPATQEDPPSATGREGEKVIRVTDLPASDGTPSASSGSTMQLRIAGAPPAAPDAALYRRTGSGLYPQIAEDGRRPSRVYARSYAASAGAPRIGLIISGLGLSSAMTSSAIETLPPEATLAFAPYTRDIGAFAAQARAAGHETMIELPMEAPGATPERLGPAGLTTGQTTEENLERLDWMLTRYAGYFGVTSYLGATFAGNEASMTPVVGKLKAAGLAYVGDTALAEGIGTSGLAHRQTDFTLPGNAADLPARLAEIEAAARDNGVVLAKIYVSADSLPAVARWAQGLKDKGIALAPASAVLP